MPNKEVQELGTYENILQVKVLEQWHLVPTEREPSCLNPPTEWDPSDRF